MFPTLQQHGSPRSRETVALRGPGDGLVGFNWAEAT